MSIFIKKQELNNYTLVHNTIISDFLPNTDESSLKVYFYGLYVLQNDIDISVSAICDILNQTETEFMRCIDYWCDLGLLECVSKAPLKIAYLPPNTDRKNVTYKKEKYEDFSGDLQELFPSRIILPTEYNEYYYLMENSRIEPQALILIVAYCVRLKGSSVRAQYVLTVAREWISKGILNVLQVERKLSENEAANDNVKEVLRALKKAGLPDIDSRECYIKWTKSWGYAHEAIIFAANSLTNGTIAKLDTVLNDYFNLSILTVEDMEGHKARKKSLYDTAKKVVMRLGLFYSSLDYVVEIYITKWINLGYSVESLVTIAHNCFIKETRTLEGMNYEIEKSLFDNGILDDASVNEHYAVADKKNQFIQKILSILSLKRAVNNLDRDLLSTWTEKWGFSFENIETATKALSGKALTLSYLSNFLARALENKFFTLDEIENFAKSYTHTNEKSKNLPQTVLQSDTGEFLKNGDINSGEIE